MRIGYESSYVFPMWYNPTQTTSWSHVIFDPTCRFFWWLFFWKRKILSQILFLFEKKSPKNENFITNLSNFNTFDYNMKEGLRFSTFIFWISPKLAKHTYGWLPLEQHHKIEKKKTHPNTYQPTNCDIIWTFKNLVCIICYFEFKNHDLK
jgi:hypothetical protein